MKLRKLLWNLFKWFLKLAFKIFVILLYGASSLAEIVLHHLNIYLKKNIS